MPAHVCFPRFHCPMAQTDDQVQAFAAQNAQGMELGAEGADPDAAQPTK